MIVTLGQAVQNALAAGANSVIPAQGGCRKLDQTQYLFGIAATDVVEVRGQVMYYHDRKICTFVRR